MKPGIRKLIEDAKAKGLRVEDRGDGAWLISTGKTNRSVGLYIFQDGTAVRADVDLGNSLSIRTQKVMREILGL